MRVKSTDLSRSELIKMIAKLRGAIYGVMSCKPHEEIEYSELERAIEETSFDVDQECAGCRASEVGFVDMIAQPGEQVAIGISPGTTVLVDAEELARVQERIHAQQMKMLSKAPGVEVEEVELSYEMPVTRQLEVVSLESLGAMPMEETDD